MKKRNNRMAWLLIAAVLVLAGLTLYQLCGQASTPGQTIQELESAVNHLDMDAALKCFDDTLAEQMRGLLDLSLSEDGLSAAKLLQTAENLLPFLPMLTQGDISADDLLQLSLEVEEVQQSGATAEVSVSGKLMVSGKAIPFSGNVTMCRTGGKWVIHAIG